MKSERHFVMVEGRRVHYRKLGSGPPVLLIHQNPRHSSEMEPLMERWADSFTCIAPDTAGLGLSDPLPAPAGIDALADSLIAFMDAIGLAKAGAYGFHSAAVQLMAALRRHPERFHAVAMGGYGLWSPEEQARFDDVFIPPFQPAAYGEHLVWLWNRLVDQGRFFPWHAARPECRLPAQPTDITFIDRLACEWLDAGDHYRQAFGGCLRAPRALPDPGEALPPTLITAYEGDPLRKHLARAGELPAGWSIGAVATPAAQQDASRDFLLRHVGEGEAPPLRSDQGEGFIVVESEGFSGLIHWKGDRGSDEVRLHAPGEALDLEAEGTLRIDLPGHGLSDPFAARNLEAWAGIVSAAIRLLAEGDRLVISGEGASALLALAVGDRLDAAGVKGVEAHIAQPGDAGLWLDALPDLAPDRFGGHLIRAWTMVRDRQGFWPWFDPRVEHAIPFDARQYEAEPLARVHRDALRARSGGPALLEAVLTADRLALVEKAPLILDWSMADWAWSRADVWRPEGLTPDQCTNISGRS